ncbi:galactosylgalactosylxylosylprotein 3-beta-glucuronosyltransferase 3-like isoform X3 [Convolutriloba macropyga]|uniref:galactosylgalactosylxylosylprotein 3-beta-glucuronosyltransferase 3-like isoform X3 n=1 Tax=Convolutriloba macropyga TaxID=536237 RepID=UPI003F51B594
MRFFRFRPSYFLTALLSLLLCYNLLTYFENSVANEVRDQIQNHNSKISMPTLYVITPTYSRKTQIADLVRLKQTLKLVPKCAWIVVEDANRTNPLVHRYIEDFPRLIYINEDSERREVDRGVAQRNRALVEIVKLKLDTNGALYFADDDNTYDAAFLNQIRWVKTVGVFNVGLIAGLPFEGPLVSEEGKVIGWKTGWNGDREFCIDMAGIVINLNFFLRPNFVHVWHTQTTQPETKGILKTFPHYPRKPLYYSNSKGHKKGTHLKHRFGIISE